MLKILALDNKTLSSLEGTPHVSLPKPCSVVAAMWDIVIGHKLKKNSTTK